MKTLIKWLAVSLLAMAGSGCVLSDDLLYGGGGNGYPGSGGYPSPDYGQGGQRFRCESDNNRQRYCTVDTRGGVQMVRQLSSTPCLRGRTWDYDRHGVWVSHGCRAEFATGYGYGDDYYGGGDNYQGRDVIRCESSDNRTRQCAVDTRGGVRLVRQLSSSACMEGRSWGYGRNEIWVSQGCRGEFQVGAGGSGWGGGYPGSDYGQTLRCESSDNRHRRCNVAVRHGVDLVRQLSGTRCMEGNNWGWDRSGIWVDRGCRAEFRVR